MPENFIWNPKSRAASITYNLTNYHKKLKEHQMNPSELLPVFLSLMFYNARDLSFYYVGVDHKYTKNIKFEKEISKKAAITDKFSASKVCRNDVGCNDTNGQMDEFFELSIPVLPAHITLEFYEKDGRQFPSFLYTIYFR